MKIKSKSSFCALVTGIFDTSIAFSYLFDIPAPIWYAATLSLKIFFTFILNFPGKYSFATHAVFIITLLSTLIVSALSIGSVINIWIETVGFVLHLVFTLLAVRKEFLNNYLKSVAISGFCISIIYLFLILSGSIEDHFGRYMFFNGNHPNLGSEIIAVSAVAAYVTFERKIFFVFGISALICTILMQGRSGMIVVSLILAYKIYICIQEQPQKIRFFLAIPLVTIILITCCVIFWPIIKSIISQIVLLDDEYRGINTGFAGRTHRWQFAINLFINSPIYGAGYGYHTSNEIDSPHNFFLYGISELGLIFIPFFVYLSTCFFVTTKNNRILLPPLLLTLIMLVFNDRFINLNPYPYILYCTILIGSSNIVFKDRLNNLRHNRTCYDR